MNSRLSWTAVDEPGGHTHNVAAKLQWPNSGEDEDANAA